MKKYIPHILIVLLAAALITMLLTGRERKLDERVTLRKQHTIPYGTYIAWNGLHALFPDANILVNKKAPGYWDKKLNPKKGNQALIIISTKFNADEEELDELVEFARRGNDVFISSLYLSSAAERMFNVLSSSYSRYLDDIGSLDKDFRCTLSTPPFGRPLKYYYPGRTFSSYFSEWDTSTVYILGRDAINRPNFVHLSIGSGNIFIQLEPLAFSNYFLLHRNNISYFEQAMSLISPDVSTIVWDEYYLNKRDRRQNREKDGWLRVLLRYPSFRAALLTAFLALLVYVLMEMRRKQRMIPVIRKPRNESLDFVKTIGRLYYEKGDHRNLGKKMSAYFLEHVRTRYKLMTNTLDQEFVKNLHYKSGVPVQELEAIVSSIKEMDTAAMIKAEQLTSLHRKLEAFYKKT